MYCVRFLILLAMMFVFGCASAPTAQRNAAWQTFHNETIAQRDAGKLTALQAQSELWSTYREMFGEDTMMNGFYAYSVKLMAAVDSGKLSLDEAQTLIDAREHEISSHKRAEAKRNWGYEAYGDPP